MNKYFSRIFGVSRTLPIIAAAIVLATPAASHAQKIVAGADDWTLTNTAFSNNNSGTSTFTFVKNVTTFFGGTTGSKFMGVGGSVTASSMKSEMSDLGFNYTTNDSTFTLTNLEQYQGVFVGGTTLNSSQLLALTQYVQAGGNVYLYGGSAGVGNSTATAEATQWNTFLNPFGLSMASSYNSINTTIAPTGGTKSLLSGVSSLYWNGSADMSLLSNSNPKTYIDMTYTDANSVSHNLIAVYNGAPAAVPEPGMFVTAFSMTGMVGSGLFLGRRRRKSAV